MIKPILSFRNHFLLGYDKVPGTLRINPEQKFYLQMSKSLRLATDFRNEVFLALQQIHLSPGPTKRLVLDGNPYSLLIAESCRFLKINIACSILRFKRDLNLHQVASSVVFCESRGIKYEFIDIDIEQQISSGQLLELGHKYSASRFVDAVDVLHCKILCEKNIFPIFAGGWPLLLAETVVERKKWLMIEPESRYSVYRFLAATKNFGCSDFYRWSPELILSYLTDPIIRSLVMNKWPDKKSSREVCEDVVKNYFNIQVQYTSGGFEKILPLVIELEKKLLAHNPNQVVSFLYQDVIKSMSYNFQSSKIKKTTKQSAA